MRARWLTRCFVVCAVFVITAIPSTGNAGSYVRGLSPESQRVVDSVIDASETVARLVRQIEEHNVVVLVQLTNLPGKLTGELVLIGTNHDWRYLLIRLVNGAPFHEMGGRLAHELQHALEVATHEDVRDQADMIRLFGRIGSGPSGGPYETYEAIEAGRDVRRELWGMAPPKPAPSPAGSPRNGREPVAS